MEDLSHLGKGWPAFGASMAAGSTIDNEVPVGKAPGSPSEQTELAAQGVDLQGHETPNMKVVAGASDSDTTTVSRFQNGKRRTFGAWDKAGS